MIVVSAPTNLATQEIIERALMTNFLENGDVLFLQSTENETVEKTPGLRL